MYVLSSSSRAGRLLTTAVASCRRVLAEDGPLLPGMIGVFGCTWNMACPSSDMAAFREDFSKAKHIVVLTGAGASAQSGVPTFHGAGCFWRQFQAQDLATPEAFRSNPSLVWEFYHYRREVVLSKHPNPTHIAIAECEARLAKQGRHVVVITQNIDELHKRAGSNNILELHEDKRFNACLGGLLQKEEAEQLYKKVGTSSMVYPAAMFAAQVSARGVPMAEFNIETTGVTSSLGYHIAGPAGVNVKAALAPHPSETSSH